MVRKTIPSLLHFMRRFLADPKKVGAILPSSQGLAAEIASQIVDRSKIDQKVSGLRYIEIGPGSGTYTREIIKKMGPTDHLDVVELDPGFCSELRKQFGRDPRVKIHEMSIFDYYADPYDGGIAGLPINQFGPQFIYDSLAKYKELMKPGACISFCEYIGGVTWIKWRTSRQERKAFKAAILFKNRFFREHKSVPVRVWKNLPPARVQHCKF